MFSGYMAYFAGGFGNIGFSDFSIIDFLSFLPTLVITGLNIIFDNFLRVVGNILIRLIAPNFLGFLVSFLLYKIPNFGNVLPNFLLTSIVLNLSIILWFIGLILLLSNTPQKWWIPFVLQLLGVLLFSIIAIAMSIKGITPSTNIHPAIPAIILYMNNIIFLLIGIGGILLSFLLIGMTIARETIRYKYLSKIIKIELSQRISSLEKWHIQDTVKETKSVLFDLFKQKQNSNSNYIYEPNGSLDLVASFRRVSAVYIHELDEIPSENGRLVLIANNIIYSIEIKSGKK